MKTSLKLNKDQYLEFEKLSFGVFSPLEEFMDETNFNSCVESMRLSSGHPFPIPIVLDINKEKYQQIKGLDEVKIYYEDKYVGKLFPTSFYKPDKTIAAEKIFGVMDNNHPGVKYFCSLEDYFVGGKVSLEKRILFDFSDYEMTPKQTKRYFKDQGWETIVGFQTRNIPHKAHEYIQKCALEVADGLFLQPLIGRKKIGDFTPQAIIKSHEALIAHRYPKKRVLLGILSTFMRYAGPREAIFHAIIRRNYGCTHFIIGRDHAGVGGYYEKYAAHELVDRFSGELGIDIFKMKGPYFCRACDAIVTEKSCPHGDDHPDYSVPISGTFIREQIMSNNSLHENIISPQVLEILQGTESIIL